MSFLLFAALAAAPVTHRLDPSPATVVWEHRRRATCADGPHR